MVNGKVFITASFNNTLISITDNAGNVVSWSSSGTAGFKGTRKSTPFAASTAMEAAARKAMDRGIRGGGGDPPGTGAGRGAA